MTMTMTMTITMIFQKNAKIRMLPKRRGERAGRTLMFQSGKKSKQSDLDFALLLGLEVTTNRDKIADNILPSFTFYLLLLEKIKFNCHPRMNLGRTKSVCRSQYKNFFYIHFPKMLKVLILYLSTVRSVQFFGKLTLGVKTSLGSSIKSDCWVLGN